MTCKATNNSLFCSLTCLYNNKTAHNRTVHHSFKVSMKVKANYDATVLQTHKKIAGDVCKVFNGLLCVNSYSNQLCAQKQLR